MSREAMLTAVGEVLSIVDEIGEWIDEGSSGEDSAEDLRDEELETLLKQIQEKGNRPRRPIGII